MKQDLEAVMRVARAIGKSDFGLAMKLSPHAHLRALDDDHVAKAFEQAWAKDIGRVRTHAMLAAPLAIEAYLGRCA